MREQPITIRDADARRLQRLLHSLDGTVRDQAHLQTLASELERANVLESAEVADDVVIMDSRVQVFDLQSGVRQTYTLVFPGEADIATNRISVLAPLGTALLGFRAGDEVEWLMPGGLRRLRIEGAWSPREPPAGLEAHEPSGLRPVQRAN